MEVTAGRRGLACLIGNPSCEVGTWPWFGGRGAENMPLMFFAAEW